VDADILASEADVLSKGIRLFVGTIIILIMVIVLPQGLISVAAELGVEFDRGKALNILVGIMATIFLLLHYVVSRTCRKVRDDLVRSGYFVDARGFIDRFRDFFLVTLKGDSHQVLLPADNGAPRITVSDDGYLTLTFDDFPPENLLLIRKGNPDNLTEEEFNALGQSEILRVFYKVYPKENGDKVESFAYSAARINYFYKLELKSGVLRIVTERHSEYEMKEYAQDLHELVSSLSELVFTFKTEASSNLSPCGIH